jgi:hypothetical protein
MFVHGPLYEKRKIIVTELQKVGLETGDIVYSASSVRGPLGIPFGKWIQKFTHSPYSHATLIQVENGEYYAIDVSDWGTRKLRVVDWFDNWGATDFCVCRLNEKTEKDNLCLDYQIKRFLDMDPSYDFNFIDPNAFYCTEAVKQMYGNCGFDLGGAFLVKDMVPWWFYKLIVIGNYVTKLFSNSSLPLDVLISVVGNIHRGMLASPMTKMIYEYDSETQTFLSFV